MKYYVYELTDPRDGSVFYVGKGSGSRANQHQREAEKGGTSPKCQRILSILGADQEVGINYVQYFECEEAAYEFEAERIEAIGFDNLTNLVLGGHGGRHHGRLKEDRGLVKAVVQLASCIASVGGRARLVLGEYGSLDLNDIYDNWLGKLQQVLKRRGEDWLADELSIHGATLGLT